MYCFLQQEGKTKFYSDYATEVSIMRHQVDCMSVCSKNNDRLHHSKHPDTKTQCALSLSPIDALKIV